MDWYEQVIRPLAFRLDSEGVHELALGLVARGVFKVEKVEEPRLAVPVLGHTFANPIGLAAGFDKNGRAMESWPDLGFGHTEVGTVTWHAQPGNPKPRLFRAPADGALINRMGFNNSGAMALAASLLSQDIGNKVGINLGKSKITPLAKAAEDYARSYRVLCRLGHYFAINVSSPNTPGLRTLQDPKALKDIIQAIQSVDATRPLLVKVAPDLEPSDLDAIVDLALETGLAGIIATNTTLSREGLTQDPNEEGGLSGKPMRQMADCVLAHVARRSQGRLCLIGVGGVFTADDAWRKIALGAHLVQMYTGWVYGGPSTVPTILKGLLQRMDQEGVQSLEELRGTGL